MQVNSGLVTIHRYNVKFLSLLKMESSDNTSVGGWIDGSFKDFFSAIKHLLTKNLFVLLSFAIVSKT